MRNAAAEYDFKQAWPFFQHACMSRGSERSKAAASAVSDLADSRR
jgi:hypothetical protein